jgi:signal transduction histidine kinase
VKGNSELVASGIVVGTLLFVYMIYELLSAPAGGHPFGHFLGILGALMMLMTEILYSLRKRWRLIRMGQVRHWLSFHIFTGIVGPTMVLMHTGLDFRGLAGLSMLLTVVVVASGFLGRYIYTAVPRTLAGIEIDRRQLRSQEEEQRAALVAWAAGKSQRMQAFVRQETAGADDRADLSPLALFTRSIQEWYEGRRLKRAIKQLEREERDRIAEIEQLLRQQQRLQRQIRSLQSARRMMGWWHTFHVPLGLTLFSSVFIHIAAVLYYGGL